MLGATDMRWLPYVSFLFVYFFFFLEDRRFSLLLPKTNYMKDTERSRCVRLSNLIF
jgi:hypothetical protein